MLNFLQILNSHDLQPLSDEQYLKEYLHSFYKVYCNEIASVKNESSQYIASTTAYAELVGLKSAMEIICKTDAQVPCKISNYAKLFYNQDRAIERLKKPRSFLDINEYANGIGAYIFHKKPIVNPHTGRVLGILYHGQKYKANNMINTLLHINGNKPKSIGLYSMHNSIRPRITLGEKQAEVLFCILLGLKEDKAIANFINSIKGTDYTIATINNAVKELYKKFDTTGRDYLIQKAITYNYHNTIPKSLIKFGSYPLDISITIIC